MPGVLANLLMSVLMGAIGAGGCDGYDSSLEPVFPEDAALAWKEMRDCRHSHEHELRHIRVFASPSAEEPYAALSPDTPYPVGATLVKLEYDDAACTDLLGYTAVQKLEPGTQPEAGDWLWQQLDADRQVVKEGVLPRCIGCHEEHCEPPYGYDLTCAEEI